ncbi:SAF domain-containing protein [Corynebacterium suranareeae]|uniref:SAF domain-containing protein n=1 Tax=Corynebacterium suranareeae TaxID=2506452 RepID=UPI000BBA68E9|nr:SAF domain-containing protein [Corynebacterium suranareeae]
MAQSWLKKDPLAVVVLQDIPAGSTVTSTDVGLRAVPDTYLPNNSFSSVDDVVGLVAASTLSSGEIATEPRFVGTELINSIVSNVTEESSTEEINMVPLSLAEPSVIPLLQHGDTISVVSQDSDTGLPEKIAAGGKVILAGGTDPSTILIALPKSLAENVAAQSLNTPLAVVLTGDRAKNHHSEK